MATSLDEEQEKYVVDLAKNIIDESVKSVKDDQHVKSVSITPKTPPVASSTTAPSNQNAQQPKSKNAKKKRKQQKRDKVAQEQKEREANDFD